MGHENCLISGNTQGKVKVIQTSKNYHPEILTKYQRSMCGYNVSLKYPGPSKRREFALV